VASAVAARGHQDTQVIAGLRQVSLVHGHSVIIIIIFICFKTQNKHKHTRKQRQAAREAQTPINAGRPYN